MVVCDLRRNNTYGDCSYFCRRALSVGYYHGGTIGHGKCLCGKKIFIALASSFLIEVRSLALVFPSCYRGGVH